MRVDPLSLAYSLARCGHQMHILLDLTEKKLARALQSNHRYWSVKCAQVQQSPIGREDGLVWICEETVNILFPLLKAQAAEQRLASALRKIGGHRIRCALGPACSPRNLLARLLGHGFTLPTHSLAGMACSLDTVGETTLGPPEIRVKAAADPSIFDHHRDPFQSGAAAIALKLAEVRPQRVWHFLAWLDGIPVGSASLLIASGVAGIYGVGVLPEYRRRGIGAEVTAAACRFAAGLGFAAAVLTSSPNGQSPYRRVGFKQICRIEASDASPEARQKTPLTAEQKEMFLVVCAGHLATVRSLLKNADTIQLQNQSGVGLLDAAAYMKRADVAEWLFKRGATMNPITAHELGWEDRIREMAKAAPHIVSSRVGDLSPLHIAILRRDTGEIRDMKLVRILVECGADLTAVDDQHRSTPLGWARAFNDLEVIEYLRSPGSPD